MRRRVIVWAALLLMLSGVTCGLMAWLPAETQAAPALLVTRTTPRPTPTPAPTTVPTSLPMPTPGATPRPPESDTPGSVIELRVDAERADWAQWWTVVQWQDAAGQWHAVEGWQGGLDGVDARSGQTGVYTGVKRWWVEQQDAGSGPFRWLVYASNNREHAADQRGKELAASAPFYLPPSGQLARVDARRATETRPDSPQDTLKGCSRTPGYGGYVCEGVAQQLWQGLDATLQAAMTRALCEPARAGQVR